MSKKYRRPLPVTSNINQASEQTLKGVSTPVTPAKAKSSTITATATRTAGYDAQKYIARDIKFSALAALFVVIILVVLYFTVR